jgi:hypothetical protein
MPLKAINQQAAASLIVEVLRQSGMPFLDTISAHSATTAATLYAAGARLVVAERQPLAVGLSAQGLLEPIGGPFIIVPPGRVVRIIQAILREKQVPLAGFLGGYIDQAITQLAGAGIQVAVLHDHPQAMQLLALGGK